MVLSEKNLTVILAIILVLTIFLGGVTTYFYLPFLMNKLGLNKTPSKEVQELFTNYNMTQTPEIYKTMDEKVMKIAQSTPSIDISNCTPYPRVVKANSLTRIKVNNPDNEYHTLIIDGKNFVITENSSTIIQMNFIQVAHDILPYSCDDPNNFSGILSITKKI